MYYLPHCARDLGPKIPSGTRLCNCWKEMTAALVMGPKIPSFRMFKPVCKHLTWSPLLPSLRVVLMTQVLLLGVKKVLHGRPVEVLKR
jgi:hypothetical protein